MTHLAQTRRARVSVESLEGRRLLSLGFQEFPLAAPAANQFVQVHDIATESSGRLAFAITRSGPPAQGSQYPTYEGTSIGEITPPGTITPLHPENDASRSAIFGLVPGPGGNLWGVAGASPARLNADGSITVVPISQGSFAQAVAPAKDGSLWFTEPFHAKAGGGYDQAIGRITPTGQVVEYPLPASGALPDQIVAGSDNAMWFTMNDFGGTPAAPKIGRITNFGAVTEYAVSSADTRPHSITLGPDGNLWYTGQGTAPGVGPATDAGRNVIGKVTPSGQVTEYALPAQANAQPQAFVLGGIVTGPDGAVWFAEPKSGHLGRIDPSSGSVTEFAVPSAGSAPNDLTLGPDGALWFTEQLGNKIGRFQPGPDLAVSLSGAGAVAGSSSSFAVASFTDRTPGAAASYAATIDWGDGTTSAGTIQKDGGQFTVVAGHAYARPASYAVSVAVGESSGETQAASGVMAARPGLAQSAHVTIPRRGPARLVLSFDGPIDPASAIVASRYTIQLPGRGGVFGAKGSRSIRVASASYDANSRTVTLIARGAVPRRGALQVAIAGEGAVAIGR